MVTILKNRTKDREGGCRGVYLKFTKDKNFATTFDVIPESNTPVMQILSKYVIYIKVVPNCYE